MTQFRKLLVGVFLIVAMPCAAAFAQERPDPDKPGPDKIVVQINEDDAKSMNLALNNVQNILTYYKENGQEVKIEVVAFGPGLHMLRQDTSPVKDRIATVSSANPQVQFSACTNTLNNMTKQEGGNKPSIVSEARMVAAGVVRIIELQKQGYVYLRP
jgi:intracellular sulfur oxidation DsrE/DsrF family protein